MGKSRRTKKKPTSRDKMGESDSQAGKLQEQGDDDGSRMSSKRSTRRRGGSRRAKQGSSTNARGGEPTRRRIYPVQNWTQFLKDGKREFWKLFYMKSSKKVTRDDFDFLKTIGTGAYGRVYLATLGKSGKFFAIKVLDKKEVVKQKQVFHIINEKRILQGLNFPFTINLETSFKDNSYLYLSLPFITGGEMFTHLRKQGKFSEPLSKFYAAQILLALEYLHYLDMIYRDLKPENLLITQNGYVKVTDFGFCKKIEGRTYTLCGTPEYIAPEILFNKGYGKSADWWSFGVLVYEMSSGGPPFVAKDTMKIYEKIMSGRFRIPKNFSDDLADLTENILQVDLSRRFGNLADGVYDIKGHRWFSDVNWLALMNFKINPPWIPKVKGANDTANFMHYKEKKMEVSPVELYPNEFKDF